MQIESRRHRIRLAEHQQDTTRQLDLTTAAVKAAVIEFHGLTGTNAKRMRGRSKVRFCQQVKDPLDLDKVDEDENEELLTKAAWLKKSASIRSSLGNKVGSISKGMHANERNRGNKQLYEENIHINKKP